MESYQLLFSNTAAKGADFLKTSGMPKAAVEITANNSIFNAEWDFAAEIQKKIDKNIQELMAKDYSALDLDALIEVQNNSLKTSDIESSIINGEGLEQIFDAQDVLIEDEKEKDISVLQSLYNPESLQEKIIESPDLGKLPETGVLPEIKKSTDLKFLLQDAASQQTREINHLIEQKPGNASNNTGLKQEKLSESGILPEIKESTDLKSLLKDADFQPAREINKHIEQKSGNDLNNKNIRVNLLNNASFEAENTIQNKDQNTDISRVELKESGNFKGKSGHPDSQLNRFQLNQNKIILSNIEAEPFDKTRITAEAVKQGVSKANFSSGIALIDNNKNSEPLAKDQLPIPPANQITTKINEVNSKITIPQMEQKPTSSSDVIHQVAERLVLSIKDGKQGVKIKLKPALLGNVMLDIFTEKGQVTVKIMAELPHIKEIIETNLHHLKAELQNHDLEIQKFDVFLDQGSGQSNKGNANAQLKNAQNQSLNKQSEKGDEKSENQIPNSEDKKKDRGVDFFA